MYFFIGILLFALGIETGWLIRGMIMSNGELFNGKEEKTLTPQNKDTRGATPGGYKLKSPKELRKSEEEREVELKMSKLLEKMEE